MRRIWMVLGLVGVTLVGAATLRHGSNWQEFHYERLIFDFCIATSYR